jgi:uncharacterized RDD family membrane protein YckC
MIYDLQKASLTKRLSAFLFDFVFMSILVVGFAWMLSVILGYDGYLNKQTELTNKILENHQISETEKKYNVSYDNYAYMTDEEKTAVPEEVKIVFDKCNEELRSNTDLLLVKEMILSLFLTNLSLSLLLSFLVWEFAIPLWLKNGQTVGKKIFSVAIMRNDGIRITPFVLFTRTILGKYTIGTMVPVLMVLMLLFGAAPLIPLSVLLLILLLQIVLYITSRTNSLIHDYVAATVAVDFQSQMIFDSAEAKNAYILRIHSEDTDKQTNSID